MTSARLPFALLSLALAACNGSVTTSHHGPGGDGGVAGDAARPTNECATFADCPATQVCRAVGGVLHCVSPDLVGDPAATCGPCAAPSECRAGVCIAPDGSGRVCEFDPECGDDLCIGGRCTPDPRGRTACPTGTCPGSLVCTAGVCGCTFSVDCPVGLVCTAGVCGAPPGGCVADRECTADSICEGSSCIPRATCDIVAPDLTGTWSMSSTLRLRESLPSWLDGLLAAVAGPARFISGDASTLHTGLGSVVDAIIAPAIRDWAMTHLPPWALALFSAIADLNDILSTWSIDESMTLTPALARDTYRGTHSWETVHFVYRGAPVDGRPEDILGWTFTPSPFDAEVVCGEFEIERHDVHVSISAIIAWLVNAVTYEATDHMYATLHDALAGATAGLCASLGDAAQAVTSVPVRAAVTSSCNHTVDGLITQVTTALDMATIGLDVMTLKGDAPIAGPNSLRPGVWNGTLAGGDFGGDFDAER